ncbi:efflux RND transporter periplasmic adaptor subunit [Alteromonas sp. KUL49]|uniref:efflux RND transporter periplasmic adaptor subunit n=1 Tax=Alteromonas sp. KUL49 TaxID=2480798 RepID=UPI00102EEA95|nr:efflux RND transporter periplasmic adaptor subunit [Alteromonas sp. KUL49]TAP40861.1 efflux RND transporter periplasmic adaptor subunit [Alteromonas sp. KUL49]GEA11041.1 copper transporter [Alteromonas sp. KUL49]
MTSKTNSITTKAALGIGLGLGIVMSVLAFLVFSPSHDMTETSGNDTKGDDKPLYWVAPMDPNFKRDKPGKSPMGMDLVPVYEESSANDSPGTVSIDPVTIQNLGVKTSRVKSIKPEGTIQAVGQVQYAQNAIEHVHPRIEGWVETLNVRTQGDFIEKGEALYSIYSPELVNAQEEFVIALNQQNAALINAAKARLRALAVPQSHVESIEKSRKISQTVTVLAPATGFIDALNVQQGMYVKPGMTMLSIASLDTVWVIADVFPNDASLLSIGQRASISSTDLPGQVFEATLDYIYPMLNSATRTVQARFVVDNRTKDLSGRLSYSLKPDMYTRVELFYGNSENDGVLIVPKQAVIRTGKSDRVVLAMEEGKYKSVSVRLGKDFGDVFEILDGVVEGDAIVTSAQFLIDSESSITSDFMRMTPVENTIDADASAWTQATVNEVLADRNMINITHGPLDTFGMMGMTMNFTLADDIAISDFEIGMDIHIEVIREPTGMFQIKTVHFVEDSSPNKENIHQHMTDESISHAAHDGHAEHMQFEMQQKDMQSEEVSAWSEATVVEVELDRRRVTLTHGYLDAFDMMGMTMGFTVASDINIDDFVVGDTVHVEIIREDNGMFQVKTLHIMGSSMEHHEAKTEGKEGHE